MNLITTGCAALASRPDQFVRLRNHAALVPLAVEEFLRFDAPIQTVGRLARESIDVGGRTIRAGRVLLLLLGSANRDERIFENPDDLNVARSPNPHLSFSIGTHFCLGAALARLEAAVLFGKLRERFARLEHAAPPVRLPSATFRSYASLPLALAAA